MKMKELSEKIGDTWSTIQYYVQQELLSNPLKTSGNMVWYPPEFVDLILKSKSRLKDITSSSRLSSVCVRGVFKLIFCEQIRTTTKVTGNSSYCTGVGLNRSYSFSSDAALPRYIPSTSWAMWAMIFSRRNFKVGVMRPCSTVQGSRLIAMYFIQAKPGKS